MLSDNASFFDPLDEIEQHTNRLPRWQQDNCTYFVTFRLADSIPQELLKRHEVEREAWLKFHPEPSSSETELEYHRKFSGQIERWLDKGHGSCRLRNPAVAELAAETLRKFHLERYQLHAWVIMPNHVHVLFSLAPDIKLDATLKSWKGVSAWKIHSALTEHDEHFWQEDYFDRFIRDANHFLNTARYIRNNPYKAGIEIQGRYLLWMSDWAREILELVDP